MFRLFLWTVLLGGLCAAPLGQATESTFTDLQAAMEAAQAGASRPGDASLNCEALESELAAVVNQPSFQSYVAKSGAAAQERGAASSAASQSALTVFSSIVPGGAWAGLAASATQSQAQQAQAAVNMQERMAQAREMAGIMPHLMRGQRVIELAQARNCAWMQGRSSR